MAVLETTFIIDLMKESKRGRIGPASLKLQGLTDAGELPRIAIFTLAELFGSIVGELEKQGQRISDIDALIASVALEHSELLVTRNRKHFDRISGLRVEDY